MLNSNYQPFMKVRDDFGIFSSLFINGIAMTTGHSSFVSCICTHGNSLVTAGWDGLIMIWPHPLAIIQGNEISPLIEDEPNKIMKIGTQSFPALIPIAIYSVTNEAILCMYKNMNNKDSLILYY